MRKNPLTAALEFVSITRIARSSTEIHSLVAETVATSFSVTDGSWTQSIVKRFVQSGLICSLLTLDFVSLTLVFLESSRGSREKRLGDMIVLGNQQGRILHRASCHTILVSHGDLP